MSRSRLSTAIDDGLIDLPEGEVAVLGPTAGYDLSALVAEQVRIVTGYRPDFDHWQARGLNVDRVATAADLAIVVMPRSKSLARALVAEAARVAPRVVVDGDRTNGVDSIWREVRARRGDVPTLTKAHGRLFILAGGEGFADWTAQGPVQGPDGLYTQAGVFSEAGPDRGSELLAAALPPKLPARMADLGAGWGYLSRAVLTREGVVSLDLIEAEALALDCARLNVSDARARFHWADALSFRPEVPYGGIVMNPPFHTGRAADPSLGRSFISAARAMLTPGGHLWLVANRHLPYEAALGEAFRNVDQIGTDGGFKVYHASRPVRPR